MGKVKCPKWCNCVPCFRAKFTPNHDTALHPLPKPKEAEDELPPVEEPPILIVRKIEPCLIINGLSHHTNKFDLMTRSINPQLVVRRGQSFRLDITFNRPYNDEKDGISFIFTVDADDKPNHGLGTLIAIPLFKRPDRHLSWNAVLENITDNTISVNIITPADAVVGKWHLEVDTKVLNDGAYSYSWDTSIFLLFNPWFKHDQVFMKSEEWREECVLNDVGLVWRGTANRMRPVVWKYDQFEKDILECSLYLIHVIGKVKNRAKADPVGTCRALAAAVNSADDCGVVMGNWSEDYSGGTPPTKWLGSKEILQKFYKKKKPVKYGQCWVFSGVLTTILRAIGIPARTITNYSSAHDTQSSLTVDVFMDEKGSIVEDLISDSIWNFHVWNEAWMQRPDLGRDYGGWQALDATPQETSEDLYRVGPTSVFAVKQGEVLRPYDGSFLYAEVNADKVFWRYSGLTQPLKLLRKDVYSIGRQISTKSPSRFEREDITSSYKYPEKSSEERSVMMKALRQSENLFSRYYLNEDFNDIYFNFELRDDIKIGQEFNVALVMKNRNKIADYKIQIILRVEVVTYQGKVGENVKKQHFSIVAKNDSTSEVKMNVTYDEYSKLLRDQCSFVISCLATVEDTKFEYFAQDDFRVRKPDIKIILKDKLMENKEAIGEIFVENPLPVPYRKGEFTVEGPGIEKKLKIKLRGNIPPGEDAKAEFKFTPKKVGKFMIAAKFVAKEIDDVDGYLEVVVEPNREENGSRL